MSLGRQGTQTLSSVSPQDTHLTLTLGQGANDNRPPGATRATRVLKDLLKPHLLDKEIEEVQKKEEFGARS